jgi:hypothetical protein
MRAVVTEVALFERVRWDGSLCLEKCERTIWSCVKKYYAKERNYVV